MLRRGSDGRKSAREREAAQSNLVTRLRVYEEKWKASASIISCGFCLRMSWALEISPLGRSAFVESVWNRARLCLPVMPPRNSCGKRWKRGSQKRKLGRQGCLWCNWHVIEQVRMALCTESLRKCASGIGGIAGIDMSECPRGRVVTIPIGHG
jgi:hypothetical protein